MAESNSKKSNKPPAQSDAANLNASARESVDVIATISHEIRTPLHAVMGLCELLQTRLAVTRGIATWIRYWVHHPRCFRR